MAKTKKGLWCLSRLDPYTGDKDIDIKGISEDDVEKRLKTTLRKFR
jgi:hypothetical protein